jgi:SNF2 family DNA or RNA helicase
MGTLLDPANLPALIVCPVHLLRQWKKDFLGVFLPLLESHIIKQGQPYDLPAADVYLCSYSKLLGWGDMLSDGRIKSIVFDEVQELRHNGTGKWNAAQAIRHGCRAALGLSATPIYNYGGEIYNILSILAPGRIGDRSEFYREWCESLGNGKYLIKDPEAFGLYLRDEFLMLRRTRADVGLELPQVERPIVTIPHEPAVLKEIEGNALELARRVLQGNWQESGEAARQLDLRLRQATGIAKAPFVAEFVRMLVENGERVLLFGWHREVYDVWMEKLKDLDPVLYTGTESPAEKAAALDAFQWRSKVMIMSLRSGVGVDGLQNFCHTAVFGELDWSPGVHEQCIGRLNRDGVGRGVLAYFLVSEAGSDPVVAGILGLKKAQQSGVMDLLPADEPEPGKDAALRQTSGARIKDLARSYLAKRGVTVVENTAKHEDAPPPGALDNATAA